MKNSEKNFADKAVFKFQLRVVVVVYQCVRGGVHKSVWVREYTPPREIRFYAKKSVSFTQIALTVSILDYKSSFRSLL